GAVSKNGPWSESEILVLRSSYETQSIVELKARLPGRTPNAIKLRAAVVGLSRPRRWTAAEIKKLEAMRSAGRSATAVAKALGRTISAVAQKCRQLDAEAELHEYLLARSKV